MSKRMKILFTLSVLLNVVLIGITGGAAFKIKQRWDQRLDQKIAHLSPEMQDQVRETVWESRREIRALMQEANNVKKDIKDVLNSEPFDEESYDLTTQKVIDLRSKAMKLRAEKTKEIIRDLAVKDRRKFAGHLLRGQNKGFRSEGFRECPKFPKPQQGAMEPATNTPELTPLPE